MKNAVGRMISLFLCLVMIVSLVPPLAVRAEVISVTEIYTAEEFMTIQDAPDGSYRLMNNISLGSIAPLGDFTGVLDGNGHTIHYSLRNVDGVTRYGLFSQLNGAEVTDLRLNADIDINADSNGYYVAPLAGYVQGGSLISAVESESTIRVNGSGNCVVGGIVGDSGYGHYDDALHSCVADNDVEVCIEGEGGINYYGLGRINAYFCDLQGNARLEGNIYYAMLLCNAVDSYCAQDLQVEGYGNNIYLDSQGQYNVVECSVSLRTSEEYYVLACYGLYGCTGSELTGSISAEGDVLVYGASKSEGVTLNCDMSGWGMGLYFNGLYECKDSAMYGDMTVEGREKGDLYGIVCSERCSYTGNLTGNLEGSCYIGGIDKSTDCTFSGDIFLCANQYASVYGISGGERCVYTGDLYAYSDEGEARVTAAGGTGHIVTGNLQGESATLLNGSNSYFEGAVTTQWLLGIGGNCSAYADVYIQDGGAKLFTGNNSYFAGSITMTNDGYVELNVFGTQQNCVADMQATITSTATGERDDNANTALFNTAGINCYYSGSATINVQYGHVGVCSNFPTTVNHGQIGSWNSGSIPVEVCVHTGTWDCKKPCSYIGVFDEETRLTSKCSNYYTRIYVNRPDGDASSAAEAGAGWDGTINPETGDYTPEREPASYTIRLVDLSDQPVADAILMIGGTGYMTDANGCVYIENGPAVISNLEVQQEQDGEYKTVMTRKAYYPIPDKVNDLRLEVGFEMNLDFVATEDAENAKGEASGGEIKIGSLTIPIFKLPISLDLEKTLFDHLPIKVSYDAEKGTVKSIIGLENAPSKTETIKGKNEFDNLFEKAKDMVANAKTEKGREAAKNVLSHAEKNHKASVFTSGWTFQVAGYAESQLTKGTQPTIIEGGVILKGEYEHRLVYHLVPWAPAAYVTFGFTGGVESEMAITDPSEPSIETAFHVNMAGSVDPKISLDGRLGMGIRTARTYIEAGVKGTLDSSIQVPFENVNDSVTVKLTGSVLGEARFLALSYAVEHEFGSLQLWPQTGSTGGSSQSEGTGTGGDIVYSLNREIYSAIESGEYTVSPRNYAQNTVSAFAARSVIETDGYVGLSGSSYPYAEVGLYPLENGNYLLLYTDDDLSRGDADRSALRACIGTEVDGALVWGEAVTVENDGTGDYGFQAVACGNNVAVVWQDANQSFGNGEDLAVSDMASSVVLSQTVLDCSGEMAAPGEVGTVANQGSYPYNISLFYDGENFRTAWITTNNPEPTSYLADEIETVWYSEGFGQEGSSVAEAQDTVSGIALVADSLLWVTGEENNMTLHSRASDGTITDVDSGNIQSLQSNGGQFCYTKDNVLYRGENSWDSVYEADSGEGYANILRLSADGSVYASQPDTDTSRVCILEGGKALPIGEYEGYLSSWDATNGHIVTVLRTGFTADDTASFASVNREEIVSMEIGEPVFDNTSITPNNWTDMTVNVSNDGYHAVESLHVNVTAEDGTVLMDEDVGCYIAPCEEGDVSFGFNIPEGFAPQDVTVTVGDQSHTVALGGTNLAVEATWESYDAKGVSVTVSNTGLTEATGTVTLTDGDGSVMDSQEVTVPAGGATYYWIEFDEYFQEDADLTITLSGVDGELTDYDNTDTVAIRPAEAKKLRVAANVNVAANETTQIEVRAIPEGSLLPVLTYASADEAIATVDENGVVAGIVPGETTVTVTAPDGTEYTVTVTVTEETEEPEEPTEPETKPTEPETEPTEPDEEGIIYRLAGENRFDTAFQVVDRMKEELGIKKFEAVIVASGTNFADALSGSYLSAVKNAPILLSFNDKYNELAKDYIWDNLAPGGTVYILGGPAAVPVSMEEGLDNFNIRRLAGSDRFGTNLAILEEAGVGDKDILICTGLSFADSLSASASERPILLVWNKLTDDQKLFLELLNGNKLYIIGGTGAVSARMEEQVSIYGNTTRIGGSNRFETSVLIAEEFFDSPENAVLAYAWNYPDGLCGGGLAAVLDAPLILTMDKFEAKAAEYVQAEGITSGYVLGSSGLISDRTVDAIFGNK